MSEPAGPTSTSQWQQFEVALVKYANLKDWKKVEKVNELMMLALTVQGKPKTKSQLLARQSLAKVHQQVIAQANAEKESLSKEMKQFQATKDGISAYKLTSLCGEIYD
ncbi:hypothetical protein LMH66_17295 [Shewanella sp. 10N.7]|uniref:hypothetical protein n=1 Tax=Shewanella sp. 10N.7 TaxID=2885093 RepID=UPI001E3DAA82|nr:hypothetical protein [Shewanella sp. 10N.7]MCC4834405.1 hypothetical protein [Shewanella sp. 10N.7]